MSRPNLTIPWPLAISTLVLTLATAVVAVWQQVRMRLMEEELNLLLEQKAELLRRVDALDDLNARLRHEVERLLPKAQVQQ